MDDDFAALLLCPPELTPGYPRLFLVLVRKTPNIRPKELEHGCYNGSEDIRGSPVQRRAEHHYSPQDKSSANTTFGLRMRKDNE